MILLRGKRSLNTKQKTINMRIEKFTPLAIILLVLFTSCYRESSNTLLQQKVTSQTNMLQLLQKIDSLGDLGVYNAAIAMDYIAYAENFGSAYPEEQMAPEFLYKAGLMAMTVAKLSENKEEREFYSQKALSIFDGILKVYPDYGNIKNCMLNKGVVYDDILHDYENAEIHYKEFIARYPTDSLAINIEAYLHFLGKTPEEILAKK